jgi:hypothetical protein
MDLEILINKYLKTLIRKNILNINNNLFLKKPYLENYIIKLSYVLDKDVLLEKILYLLDHNKINNEELFLIVKNNIELSDIKLKDIEKYFLENNIEENINKIAIEIIMYQIKYFRTFHIITEFLFDINNKENYNELYYFILIFIKSNNNEIKILCKNNFKFNIFNNNINDLYISYENIINLLSLNISKKDILNLFLKNLFVNWYNIYKKDILEDKVNNIIKKYEINNKNILLKMLCYKSL